MKSQYSIQHTHYPMTAFGKILNRIEKIRINRLEDRLTPLIPFPHKHDFFQVLILKTGSGWHEIDFIRHRVRGNSVFMMKPGQIHSWVLSPKTKGFVVEFELNSVRTTGSEIVTRAEILSRLPDCFQMKAKQKEAVLALGSRMLSESESVQFGFESMMSLQLAELLLHFSRANPQVQNFEVEQNSSTDQFLSLLEKFFRSEHRVEFYAQHLGLSTNTLTMRISRALGASPRSLIHGRCLLEAKRMLGYSNHPVSQIAYALGFEDPNYFSRFFRQQTKLTPAEFRKKWQKMSD